jgi:hypothetical protein
MASIPIAGLFAGLTVGGILLAAGYLRLFLWASEKEINWLVIALSATPFFLFVLYLTFLVGGLLGW